MSHDYKLHHYAISVINLNDSIEFYSSFEYKEISRWEAKDGSLIIVHLKSKDAILELFAYKANDSTDPLSLEYGNDLERIGMKHVGLQVASLATIHKILAKKVAKDCLTDPKKGRTGIEYFFVKDPNGIWLEIVQDNRTFPS